MKPKILVLSTVLLVTTAWAEPFEAQVANRKEPEVAQSTVAAPAVPVPCPSAGIGTVM